MTTSSALNSVLGVSPGPSASAADIANAMATVPSPDPSSSGGDPLAQIIVGVVQSTQFTASPPTVTCTLRGSATQVSGLRFLAGYVPQVGDRVRVAVIGGSHWIVGVLNPSGTLGGAARQTLSSPASSVTFSSIPAGYTALRLTAYITGVSSSGPLVLIYNGDGGGNYNWSAIYGNGTVAAAASGTSTYPRCGYMASTAAAPTLLEITIGGYATSTPLAISKASRFDVLSSTGMYPEQYAVHYADGPVTSVGLYIWVGSATLSAGSTATLQGIP